MAISYYNRTRTRTESTDPGMRNRAFIAPQSWFAILQPPNVADTLQPIGFEQIIPLGHTFAASQGFMEVYCTPNKNQMTATTGGETGSRYFKYVGQIFIPGDGPATQSLLKALLNDDLIVLMEDATCPDGAVVQLGCECKPANFGSTELATQTTGADGSKGWTINIESNCRWFYEGEIVILPETP